MGNYYEYLKQKPIYYSLIVYGILFLIFFKFFMDICGYFYIAEYKSKNPLNVIEGCVYYSGVYKTKNSNDLYLSMDGYVFNSFNVTVKEFPFYYKQKVFFKNIHEDKISCKKIKYIEINLILTKKIFIYDYLV
jgi:hypothetical protein